MTGQDTEMTERLVTQNRNMKELQLMLTGAFKTGNGATPRGKCNR